MGKASKTAGKQHIHSRISFLFKAANYLSSVEQESQSSNDGKEHKSLVMSKPCPFFKSFTYTFWKCRRIRCRSWLDMGRTVNFL